MIGNKTRHEKKKKRIKKLSYLSERRSVKRNPKAIHDLYQQLAIGCAFDNIGVRELCLIYDACKNTNRHNLVKRVVAPYAASKCSPLGRQLSSIFLALANEHVSCQPHHSGTRQEGWGAEDTGTR